MIARRILLPILLCGVAACSNASGEGGAEGARARAVAALEQGRPRTARVELLNAIKAAPSDGALRILQARVYLALGAKLFTWGFISRAKRCRKCLASRVASPCRSASEGMFTTISASR